MSYLIYLHGFNSSPQSEKAQLTLEFFEKRSLSDGNRIAVLVPHLSASPLDAIAQVHDLIDSLGRENLIGFIGSSLGGFYSVFLQRYYSDSSFTPKVVLLNPALRPYELLSDYLGENQNMYTGERYIVEASHMEDLKSLISQPIKTPEYTMLLTQTGDEVLNFQEAIDYLDGAAMWVQYGGTHAFDRFSNVLPAIWNYFSTR